MKVLSIINLKGGVAKTISSVNMAHILAAVKGFKKAMSDDEPKKDAEFTQIKDGTNTAEKTETVKDKEQA